MPPALRERPKGPACATTILVLATRRSHPPHGTRKAAKRQLALMTGGRR
ncbi:hypothetical protein ABZ646_17270 [Streptomyces sp. NPDC007162]